MKFDIYCIAYGIYKTGFYFSSFWLDPRHHDFFTTIYIQAHYRGTSYLMGLMAGCYVYSHRQDEPITRVRSLDDGLVLTTGN